MSAAALEPDELDAIREAIQQAQAPSSAPRIADVRATPIALIADDRAAERGRPTGLKIATRWARLVEKGLARLTGLKLSVSVSGVETIDGGSMRDDTNDAWCARVEASGGDGLVVITGALIEGVAARLLGDRKPPAPSDRPPSPVARRLFGPAGNQIVAALIETWRDELGGKLTAAAGGEAWRHQVGAGDLVVVVTLTTTSPSASIRLIARPELLAGATSTQDAGIVGPEVSAATLGEVPIEVKVELGRARLTMAELLALEPGAVIALDRVVDEPLPISCGGVVKARGVPLSQRGAIAIEITSAVRPEKK